MKDNVAYIIEQMSKITMHSPVKKALQKTVFLIERKGVDLGFKYMLHFYGPYCAELDHATAVLNSSGVIAFTYDHYGHKMNVNEEYRNIESKNLKTEDKQIIQDVIMRYKNFTASDLELLTTAIYVYDYIGAKTKEGIKVNVKNIKGDKYSDHEIETAIKEFAYFNISL